jgi:hypothetical protein
MNMAKIREIEQDMKGINYQVMDVLKKCEDPAEVEIVAGYIGLLFAAITTQDKSQMGNCLEVIERAKDKLQGTDRGKDMEMRKELLDLYGSALEGQFDV